MHLKILHTTTYHFDQPVAYGLQQLRLIPKSRAGQVVRRWHMEIDGGRMQTEFNDHHQNRVTLISFDPHATSIVVHCEGEGRERRSAWRDRQAWRLRAALVISAAPRS